MSGRQYYSQRKLKQKGQATITLEVAKELFVALFNDFRQRDLFQEFYGYECVDAGYVDGKAGPDVGLFFLRRLRKKSLWPIDDCIGSYTEDDLFDVIELLYDTVSQGLAEEGYFHSFCGCGWHYRAFSQQPAKEDFRAQINEILADYGRGFELSKIGHVLELPAPDLHQLVEAHLPKSAQEYKNDIEEASAILRWRHSSLAQRRQAVRMLADVLEHLRPKLQKVISKKDEGDLFNIANNFGIRHKNNVQKTDYDPLWLSWIFYYYLATIHFVTRRLENAESGDRRR